MVLKCFVVKNIATKAVMTPHSLWLNGVVRPRQHDISYCKRQVWFSKLKTNI